MKQYSSNAATALNPLVFSLFVGFILITAGNSVFDIDIKCTLGVQSWLVWSGNKEKITNNSGHPF